MDTMLLDRSAWDLCADANGNWAVASDPYSQLQDVSSACRTFAGEVYYDTGAGIPYFAAVLGRSVPLSIYKTYLVTAAKTVPGVDDATVYFDTLGSSRVLTGQVQSSLGIAAF